MYCALDISSHGSSSEGASQDINGESQTIAFGTGDGEQSPFQCSCRVFSICPIFIYCPSLGYFLSLPRELQELTPGNHACRQINHNGLPFGWNPDAYRVSAKNGLRPARRAHGRFGVSKGNADCSLICRLLGIVTEETYVRSISQAYHPNTNLMCLFYG